MSKNLRFRTARILILGVLVTVLAIPAGGAAPQIDEATEIVEKIRGHRFSDVIEHRTLTRAELREFLRSQIERDLELSFDDYMTVIKALYLVPEMDDPMENLLDLFDAQVLAFYDPVEHVFYSVSEPPEGAPVIEMMENAIVVHELTHALQDQVFQAGQGMEEVRGRWDHEMAFHAMIEGEATLVMMESIMSSMGASLDELAKNDEFEETLLSSGAFETQIPPGTPRYFVEMLKFPYLEGLRFLLAAYRAGGWARVDDIWENPPSTSEQILDPEAFLAAEERVTPVEIAGASRAEERPSGPPFEFGVTLGEFHWRFLLGESVARGWGGDWTTIKVNARGETTVLVDSRWDTAEDAEEFAEAYETFLKGNGAGASVQHDDRTVRVAYGQDREAVARFLNPRVDELTR